MLPGLLSRFWNRWMVPLGHLLRGRPRFQIELLCLAIILVIGALDYEAGLDISLSPLYAAPLGIHLPIYPAKGYSATLRLKRKARRARHFPRKSEACAWPIPRCGIAWGSP